MPVRVLRSLGTTCGICGETVDLAIHRPDTRAPSVDHIVPVALGGNHSLENLQMAHLWCNQAKHLRERRELAARRERQRFYNLQAWRLLAATVRREEPTCRRCGEPSACAGHIVSPDGGGLLWDRSNIEALCTKCHMAKAQETYRSSLAA